MDAEFAAAALQLFYSQSRNNPVYAQYISYLGVNPENVSDVWHIPFLPVQFFKTHEVISGGTKANECDAVFTSSGTTGMSTSRHYVKDIEVYYQSLEKGFTEFYGSPQNYTILALLPSYLERKGSSLIVMAQRLMQLSQQDGDGFFLYDFAALHNRINREIASGKRVLLIGVTFALMDFAREFPAHYGNDVRIRETGGMKGRRKELTRYEVHAYLTERLGVTAIHSEYGMTELLSQAYSNGGGIYRPSSTMCVIIRDSTDPLISAPVDTAGGVNVIDLANRYSCAFIETQDIGILHSDESFEILGRFDASDIRGCSLMYTK